MDSLKLLTEKDLESLFGTEHMDLKVRLREKLQKWPKSVQFIKPQEGTSKPKSLQLLSSSVKATDLEKLLTTNEKGKILAKYYELNSKLTSTMQTDLASIIADSYIANQRKLPIADMRKYAQLIPARFKSETEVLLFWLKTYQTALANWITRLN